MIVNLYVDAQRKEEYLKEQQKSLILMLLVIQEYKMFFSIQNNLSV